MSKLTEERYQQLKNQVESARTEAARAQGMLDSLLQRLKNEFGCASVKEAKVKLATLCKEHSKLEAEFETMLEDYESKWHTET